ncbi:MAG TPA: hypothetical protein VGG82_05825 [Casimicrobiaceae bacterium]
MPPSIAAARLRIGCCTATRPLHVTAAHWDGRCNFRRIRGRSARPFARLAVRALAIPASLGPLPLELPRCYIHELKGLVPCDPETPVGVACAQ